MSPCPDALPLRVLHFAEAVSTNAEAMRLGIAGEAAPLWVTADRQTGGKGRSGRSWTSEPGNLHASLLVRLPMPLASAYQLSLVTGVAAIDAIRAALPLPEGTRLELKWPNDILLERGKAGGILIESAVQGGELIVVAGLGLNLKASPAALGDAARHFSAYAPVPEPRDFLAHLDGAMKSWISVWDLGHGFDRVRDAWLKRALASGEPISVNSQGGLLSGAFGGIDADGALLLAEPDGRLTRITYGDVTLQT